MVEILKFTDNVSFKMLVTIFGTIIWMTGQYNEHLS
jgi:hypothetical protein